MIGSGFYNNIIQHNYDPIMLNYTIGFFLILIVCVMLHAAAYQVLFPKRIVIRFLSLATCIFCSSTYMFAMYSQTYLNNLEDKIGSLPEDCFDNQFVATTDSIGFHAKDLLALDITFDPLTDPNDDSPTFSSRELQIAFPSPSTASGFSRLPMFALGIPLWVVTFLLGWLFRSAFDDSSKPNASQETLSAPQ